MQRPGILIWVGGFAGILLLYAAYKNRSPLGIIKSSVTSSSTSSSTPVNPVGQPMDSAPQHSGDIVQPTTSYIQQDGQYVSVDQYGYPGNPLPQAYQNAPWLYQPRQAMV